MSATTDRILALLARLAHRLDIHSGAELRAATQAVHARMTADLDVAHDAARRYRDDLARSRAEADALRKELERATATRTGDAVELRACPRCGAPAGSRCVGPSGEVLRRTHRERTEAHRAALDAEAGGVDQ